MFKWLLFFPCILSAHLFNWFDTLSHKAELAQTALLDLEPRIEKALIDYQVPGLAIAVVVDGHIIYAKGFGFRDLEEKKPVTKETVFPIGSCTKAFTTFAMGTLVDEGLISWDASVIDALPEFRLWDEYATTKLTLRDLLTHRTGIPRHDFVWYNSKMSKAELLKRLRHLEPSFEMRERYHYGQLTYFTAGLALEEAAKKPWDQLIQEKILNPLGMHSTSFSTHQLQKGANFASPYLEKNDRLKKIAFRNLDLIGPAGAMNSSVEDLSQWMQMLLKGGRHQNKTLISPATLQELYSPQVIVPGVPETKETLLHAYAMGWLVVSYRGHFFASHDGVSDGFTSVLGMIPSENVGVVVLCNKNMTSLPRYLSLTVLDKVLHLPEHDWLKEGLESYLKTKESLKANKIQEDQQRKKNAATSHPMEDYVGIYEHPGYGRLAIEWIDGNLELHYNDLAFVLDHWHYDVFSIVKDKQDMVLSFEGTKLSFNSDTNGEVGEISVPFEPTSDGIVFKKKPNAKHSTLTYLKKYTGVYKVYGYVVEIALKNNALIAIIPGQSTYELVPMADHEFSVKSMTGATVRFLMDEEKVKEALLIYPYGAVSATRQAPH